VSAIEAGGLSSEVEVSTRFRIGEIVHLDGMGSCAVIAIKAGVYDVVLLPNGVISHGIEEKRLAAGPHATEYRADNVRLREERSDARVALSAAPNETLLIAVNRVIGERTHAQLRLAEAVPSLSAARDDLREALYAIGAENDESAAEAALRVKARLGEVIRERNAAQEQCGDLLQSLTRERERTQFVPSGAEWRNWCNEILTAIGATPDEGPVTAAKRVRRERDEARALHLAAVTARDEARAREYNLRGDRQLAIDAITEILGDK
jgi:hypothetical protein